MRDNQGFYSALSYLFFKKNCYIFVTFGWISKKNKNKKSFSKLTLLLNSGDLKLGTTKHIQVPIS
jgi:hypothetical protein